MCLAGYGWVPYTPRYKLGGVEGSGELWGRESGSVADVQTVVAGNSEYDCPMLLLLGRKDGVVANADSDLPALCRVSLFFWYPATVVFMVIVQLYAGFLLASCQW